MRAKLLFVLLLLIVGCRERINPYDPGGDDFMAPPPIYFSRPILGWYDNNGYLIGVRMQVDFVDAFPRSFEIRNVLFRGTEELARDSIPVGAGMDSFVVDLIGNTIMDTGEYLVIHYWDEFSIGSCLFYINFNDGAYFIRNVSEYDTLRQGY
ncbi:MAG: hypothetical protein JSV98_00630 [candidate division WOR-3 bacterium]|nr:MAG: hypothetical protein JSV98_00630 [candidate division WOR-3 bacterium]